MASPIEQGEHALVLDEPISLLSQPLMNQRSVYVHLVSEMIQSIVDPESSPKIMDRDGIFAPYVLMRQEAIKEESEIHPVLLPGSTSQRLPNRFATFCDKSSLESLVEIFVSDILSCIFCY